MIHPHLCDVKPNFYPRSPCGERPKPKALKSRLCVISIHALLAESDAGLIFVFFVVSLFLSTLSLRRATANAVDQILPGHISIHALLAESDSSMDDLEPSTTHFYPRSPCGERRLTSQTPF